MQVQPVHPVDLLSGCRIITLTGQDIMVKNRVGKADLILVRHPAQPVGRSFFDQLLRDIEDFTEPSGWFSIGTATFSAGATTRATHEVYAA